MSKSKHKVYVDKRVEVREFEGKVYDAVQVSDASFEEEFANAVVGADWTDDPGTGRAILMPDGRELLNPLPVAPPITFKEELSVNDLVERALKMHYERLANDEEVRESLDELLTFDDDDDLEPASPWEVIEREMSPEVPDIPKGDPTVVPDVVVPPPEGVEPKPPSA